MSETNTRPKAGLVVGLWWIIGVLVVLIAVWLLFALSAPAPA